MKCSIQSLPGNGAGFVCTRQNCRRNRALNRLDDTLMERGEPLTGTMPLLRSSHINAKP